MTESKEVPREPMQEIIDAARALVPLLKEGWDEYDTSDDQAAGSAAIDRLIAAVDAAPAQPASEMVVRSCHIDDSSEACIDPREQHAQDVAQDLAHWLHRWPGGAPNEAWSALSVMIDAIAPPAATPAPATGNAALIEHWRGPAVAVADRQWSPAFIAEAIERHGDKPPLEVNRIDPARTPEEFARLFHDAYERLAPTFGYTTRTDTRSFDPASPNGRLMVAVAQSVLFDAAPAQPASGNAEWRAPMLAKADRILNEICPPDTGNAALIEMARTWIDPTEQRTHWDGCEQLHYVCMIAKLAAALAAADARVAELERENESLRAECGLRQIAGYNKGKEEASARLYEAEAEQLTRNMRLRAEQAEARAEAAIDELRNIVNAKRNDREAFPGDTEFADWAQSRARFTLAAIDAARGNG